MNFEEYRTYDATGLAKLAEGQEKVKVSLRQVDIAEGVKAKSNATLEGKHAAEFVRGICGSRITIKKGLDPR